MDMSMSGEKISSLTLENDQLLLRCLPSSGAKMVSLYHKPRQTEWLAKHPSVMQKVPGYGASFVRDYDTGGWDECFPTVAECNGYPDHGELWCQPWQLVSHTANRLHLHCEGCQQPYGFSRLITLDGPRIRVDYHVENTGTRALDFVWSMHPLLAPEPGMQLILPPAVTLDAGLVRVPGSDAGWANKTFVTLPENDLMTVGLVRPDGHGIWFRFSTAEVPHLGLWLNYGGWSGGEHAPGYHIGVEPCIGDRDSLAEAICDNRTGQLVPGEVREWTIEIEVD